MISRDPPWDALRTFGAVMREASLSGAARRLALSQPTVGRHIDALEQALGLSLFTRSPQGLAPTPDALALAPHIEAMAGAAAALERAASGEAAADRGVVRVTASEVVGCEVLPAIFASFRAVYPNVAIELALTNRNEDLARREADIAVRMNRPTQSALVARRIGRSPIALYAHRDYLARCGTPQTLADLASHCFIGFDRDDRTFRTAGKGLEPLSRETFGFRTDSDLAQLAALRAGVGVGGCQTAIARREPALVPVLPGALRYALEVWLVMHEDAKATRRIRLAFDHLARGLTDYLRGAEPLLPLRAKVASPSNDG